MNSKIISNGILRALSIIIGIALFLYFLNAIQSVLVYILIAAVISLIARPIIRFLKRKLKFPNTLAVVSTMLIFIGLLVGLIGMFIPLIIERGESLSLLKTDELQKDIQSIITQINDYFSARNINLLNELKNVDFISSIQAIPNLLNSVASTLGSLSVGLFSVLFIFG